MSIRPFALAALAALATLGTAAAHARNPVEVQWQVVIGGPIAVLPGYGQVVLSSPTYRAEPVYRDAPVVVPPRHAPRYRQPSRWDRDGDGIPNRHDRVYNPRWDRDGDGIPNRNDRDERDRRGGGDRGHRGGG